MLIVDSQIHLWENARMSPHHRQIPTYNVDDALKEMAEAGVDAAVIHPPSTLGEGPNVQAVEAVKAYPQKFCILGNLLQCIVHIIGRDLPVLRRHPGVFPEMDL